MRDNFEVVSLAPQTDCRANRRCASASEFERDRLSGEISSQSVFPQEFVTPRTCTWWMLLERRTGTCSACLFCTSGPRVFSSSVGLRGLLKVPAWVSRAVAILLVLESRGRTSAEYAARQVLGFCTAGGPANPSEVGVHVCDMFVSLAVIDTVMRGVSVDKDRNLLSCYTSLYVSSGEPTLAADVCQSASRTRRNCGDAVAHHRAHNTMHQPQHGGGWRRRFCVAPVPRCQSDRLHKPQVPRCRYFTA